MSFIKGDRNTSLSARQIRAKDFEEHAKKYYERKYGKNNVKTQKSIAILVAVIVIGALVGVDYSYPQGASIIALRSYNGGIAALVSVHGLMTVSQVSVSVSDLNLPSTPAGRVDSKIAVAGNPAFVDFASIDPNFVGEPETGQSPLGFSTPVVVYANVDYSGVCGSGAGGQYFVSIDLNGTWSWFNIPLDVGAVITPEVC